MHDPKERQVTNSPPGPRDIQPCFWPVAFVCPQGPAAPGPGFYSAALAFVEDPEGQLARLHLCLTPSLLTCAVPGKAASFPFSQVTHFRQFAILFAIF